MARRAVLGRGDMVVIPRFALTEKKALPTVGELDRLPLRKGNLVDAIKGGNTTMALWDKGWSLNEGPSNWDLWKKSKSDRGLAEDPRRGGGKGLGFPDDFDVFGSSSATTQNETSNDAEKERPIGGGKNLYLAHNYDYRFSPSILMSKEGHPWCTERFEHKWEACVYQNYLGGAEVWILPDAWSWVWNIDSTTSAMSGPEMRGDEETDLEVVDEAEAIKEAISDKLYKKYRQEACMHYGRELLLMDLWEHERARHLRAVCARVFSSWGVGLVSHLDV
ncbi:glycosyltransferase family 49 protein [Atractiella rhizophila]|nr:glycosyltransferase family 49 protein [Atractiella rhizophila]